MMYKWKCGDNESNIVFASHSKCKNGREECKKIHICIKGILLIGFMLNMESLHKRALYSTALIMDFNHENSTIFYNTWTSRINQSFFQIESNDAPMCREIESPDDIGTTLVTQLSTERLWMMQHHCKRYGSHPMSIAVYSNSTRDQIVTDLEKMGCRIDSGVDATNVDNADDTKKGALVSVAVLDAHTHGDWNDYPINQLRNLALKSVKTTHMTYIDVDFWPSEGFYENIITPETQKRLFEDPQLALVIPAFQLQRQSNCTEETKECSDQHVTSMPRTTYQVKKKINHGIEIFTSTNKEMYGSTNYQHWLQHQLYIHNDQNRLYEIPCLKSNRFEPFLTIRYCRELTPPFQSVFSGYGKNKMTWMMQVVASGFVFSQVGGAYLVHYPHPVSKSREEWNRAPEELVQSDGKMIDSVRSPKKSDGDLGFDQYHRGRDDDLYVRFRQWLKESIPDDIARMHMCDGAQNVDHDLWIDPSRKLWTEDNHGLSIQERIKSRIRKIENA